MPYAFPADLIPTPLEVLCLYDEDVLAGRIQVHPWQSELLTYLGKPKALEDRAVQAMLLAANGSGKSQMIIAPFAVWMALRFTESLTIVTTSSGQQLDTQDLRYITRMARKVNALHKEQFGMDVFDCQYRKFRSPITESFIDMFATDEAGKAEGRHPLKYDGEFSIIVDEAKTVDDKIFEALERCSGFTRRLDVSSPGKSSGYFYTTWNLDQGGDVYKRKVTAFECPHIKEYEIQQKIAKYGLHDPLIRSSIFAEFSSTDEQVVIPRELLSKNTKLCDKQVFFGPLRAGLDLASGGDETVLSVWRGNVEVGLHTVRNKDTSTVCNKIIEFIQSYKGQLKPENIYADDGGIGRSMLDNLREKGYKINRILNQSRPYDSTRYANKGTELWFSFKRFVEEFQVYLNKDDRGNTDNLLFSQLSNRYYTIQQASNKIILESKEKARKQGHPSPDRADAVILAWAPYVYPVPELNGPATASKPKRGLTVDELFVKYEESLDKEYQEQPKQERKLEYKGTERFNYSHKSIYKPSYASRLRRIIGR